MSRRLIARLPNWLGDTVMAVPALRALREAIPEARILAAGPWVGVLRGQGLADVLVSYPRAWKGRLRVADTVREFRADTAVLLPNSLEAALAACYWGARRRIGFAVGARTPLLTDRPPLPWPRRHQIDEYLLLAERLHARVDAATPALTPPPADGPERAEARALLAPARRRGRRVVAIHLGAAYGSAKVWPSERVLELCAGLAAAGDAPLLLGAAADAARVAPLAAAAGAESLAGRDRPELLPALLVEVEALVSGDTGLAHLAAALGTPAVTLFGPTDPGLTAPRGPATVLREAVPCAPCFYRECPIEHPCLRGLGADRVQRALEAALTARAS